MLTSTQNQDTSARLLEAAIEVFTEMGYRDATLRTICKRANANIAAVNYHFRDKEHLYLAVIEQAVRHIQEGMPRADSPLPLEDRLRAFIHSMLSCLLDNSPPTWLMKIISRELVEPTMGLDLLIEKGIIPFETELGTVVRELIGPTATDHQVIDCVRSVIAQCQQFNHGRAAISRMGPYKTYDQTTIDHLTDHITQFSLAGIRGMRDVKSENSVLATQG